MQQYICMYYCISILKMCFGHTKKIFAVVVKAAVINEAFQFV